MRSAAAKNPGPAPLLKFYPPKAGEKILVAVSGGVDSMVLLHLIHLFSAAQRWKLMVAHFNHCLRGKVSDADAVFVGKAAASRKLPFVSKSADVKKFATDSGLSIEMAARKLRHEFLAETARAHNIKHVALAHHADDQVELFFLRLLRGAGGSGIAGMKLQSPSPADKKLTLIRPLLDCSKAELEVFARSNKIRYRQDSTNFSTDYLRNQIRHELLPLLRKKYQPALNKTILRTMEIVGAESEVVSKMAQPWLRHGRNSFEKLSIAVQREILKQRLIRGGITADFDLIEFLRLSPGKAISIVANVSVSRDQQGRVAVREHPVAKFNEHKLTVELGKAGETVFDGVSLKWKVNADQRSKGVFTPPKAQTGMENFDAGKLPGEIVLRHWRAGDRFQPLGLKSAIKIQDLFTNQKIPREQRHKLIVAETGSEIFWVEGLRISEKFKLTPQTTQRLTWQWQR
jgi:tRNA(Ile)-lysidine synthase